MSVQLTSDTVLTADPAIVWREVAGEVVLLNPNSDRIMGLNGCGGTTWKLLDGVRSLGDIANEIASNFAVGTDKVLADVVTFAAVLVERGLAEITA